MLSVKETAARLGCSDDTVSRLIDIGDLRAVNIRATGKGMRLRISEDDLTAFIKARTIQAGKASP